MLDFMKLEIKNKHQIQRSLRLTIGNVAPEGYQVRQVLLETFKPSHTSSKLKNENDAIRNRISPTLTSDTLLNQKPNKQTSHE